MRHLLVVAGALLCCGQAVAAQHADPRLEGLIAADRAWYRAIADRDVEQFSAMLAENATYAGTMGPISPWRDAIKNVWAPYFRVGGPTIAWSPTAADVLGGGDVGYTRGTFERRVKDASGRETVIRGEYLTVFRRFADGTWKVLFDTATIKPEP